MSIGRQENNGNNGNGGGDDSGEGEEFFEGAGVEDDAVDQRLDDVTGTDSRENWDNG